MGDKLTEGIEALGFLPLTPNLAVPELYSKLEAEVRESMGSVFTKGAGVKIDTSWCQRIGELEVMSGKRTDISHSCLKTKNLFGINQSSKKSHY